MAVSYFDESFVSLVIEFDNNTEIEIESNYTCFEIFNSATYT